MKKLFLNQKKTTLITTIMIISILMIWAIINLLSDSENYTHKRAIRYGFTLQNKTNQVLTNVDFWVYAPVKITSHQKSETIKATSPYTLKEDKTGNQVLHFKITQLAPYASKIINIDTTLSLAVTPQHLSNDQVELYQTKEKYVELDDPKLIQLAAQFKQGSDRDIAKKTLDWVKQNIKYAGYIEDDQGASYAFKSRKGDCTEYMYLYTALLRINGIATKNIGGYVYSENTVLKAEDFHNWSEIYLDGKWQVVDPQNGKFLENQNNYIGFRIISDKSEQKLVPANTQRFAISSENISVRMN